jgi:hypothetical protein
MAEGKCKYCGTTTQSQFSFAYDFCPGTDHRTLYGQKIAEEKARIAKATLACQFCAHVWTPRDITKPSARCPKCLRADYNVPPSELEPKLVVCSFCGEFKTLGKIVCPTCRRGNTEKSHVMGLSIKQFQVFMTFLERYRGEEEAVVRFKDLAGELGLIGRTPTPFEELPFRGPKTAELGSGKTEEISRVEKPKNPEPDSGENEERELSVEEALREIDSVLPGGNEQK